MRLILKATLYCLRLAKLCALFVVMWSMSLCGRDFFFCMDREVVDWGAGMPKIVAYAYAMISVLLVKLEI